jgi:REP element-mobilizing transposase RayT
VEQEIRRICEVNTWTIGALNVQEDHVHLFRESLPRLLLPH